MMTADASPSAFDLDDTQAPLRDSLSRLLAERFDLDLRQRALSAADREPPLWRGFAQQLGLLGAGFDEAHGGFGGDLRDQWVVMETLGRHLAAEPYLSTVLLGGQLLLRAGGPRAQTLLGQMIEGVALPVPALLATGGQHERHDPPCVLSTDRDGRLQLDGRASVVHGGPWATALLVSARHRNGDDADRTDRTGQSGSVDGGDSRGRSRSSALDETLSLFVVDIDAPGLHRRAVRTIDGGWASEVRFDRVTVSPADRLGEAGQALPLLTAATDAATLGVCAEACGVLSRLMADTLAYVRERRQFGQPLASFQVLQHRLADMAIALEQLRAVTAWAAELWVRSDERDAAARDERSRAVASAKVCAARACRLIGQGAVQMHGGMGMTEELAIGHYFRRATMLEQRLGSAAHQLRRVEAFIGA